MFLERNGIIPDQNFASSSIFLNDRSWQASEGRLNNTAIPNKAAGVWCASKDDRKPWLSVKLLETAKVTRIAIQGPPTTNSNRVKKYKLSYSLDGKDWVIYQENGKDHVSKNMLSVNLPMKLQQSNREVNSQSYNVRLT